MINKDEAAGKIEQGKGAIKEKVGEWTGDAELETEGFVGSSAPSHYSFMGYILKEKELLETSTPAMIEQMKREEVDAVLLVPV